VAVATERRVAVQLATALLGIVVMARGADAESLEARPADGRIVVHAYKAGLFSGFAHDHHFEVTEWRAVVNLPGGEPGGASVQVVFSAASLRDRQPSLSEGDRRKVEGQAAGPDVLDAVHHPRVEFRSERLDVAPDARPGGHVRGTLHGKLTVRGRTVDTDVPFEAERASGSWQIRGKARLKQSAFGIKPFSGFGGTVKVKDDLDVEIAFTLRPSAR
jgi:polyisoprenoid-binding protein YceI